MQTRVEIPKSKVLALIVLTALVVLLGIFIVTRTNQPSFITSLNVGPFLDTRVKLNAVGFILPAAISIAFLTIYYGETHFQVGVEGVRLFTYYSIGVIALTLLALIIPLQYVIQNKGVGENVGLFLLSLVFLFKVDLEQKERRTTVLLAFPALFLTGMLSDLTAIRFTTGFTTFGGGGFYDGDLFYPTIFFTVFCWLWIINQVDFRARSVKK